MLYSYNEAREKMSLRKLQRRENSILYCIEKKWCVSKWTCAIQTPVVEGSAVVGWAHVVKTRYWNSSSWGKKAGLKSMKLIIWITRYLRRTPNRERKRSEQTNGKNSGETKICRE